METSPFLITVVVDSTKKCIPEIYQLDLPYFLGNLTPEEESQLTRALGKFATQVVADFRMLSTPAGEVRRLRRLETWRFRASQDLP